MTMAMCDVCDVFVFCVMFRVDVIVSCCAVCAFRSCTENQRCVYIQNAPVCAVKTPVSHKTLSF